MMDPAVISDMPLPPAPEPVLKAGGHDDIAPCIETEFMRWRRVLRELDAIEAGHAVSRSRPVAGRSAWDRVIQWILTGEVLR